MSKLIGLIEVNELENGTDVMNNNRLLTSVNCPFPKLHTANRMFYNCSALTTFKSDLPSLFDGGGMFRECHALTTFDSKLTELNSGRYMFYNCSALTAFKSNSNKLNDGTNMFRFCSKLNENNFNFDNFNETLTNGLAMFHGTSFTTIPCKFPSLIHARQMFMECNISGHLDLDMPRDFPNVKTNSFQGGDCPTAYMFGSCPITSISFDVSTCDNCISMFNNCTQLTTCTKAVFKQGGSYQSMFTESRFDLESAKTIFVAAKEANVQALHIGIDAQLTEEHNFVKDNLLIIHPEDNSGTQWMYKYCDSHTNGDCTCEENYKYIVFRCNTDNVQTASIDDTNHAPTID